MAKWQRIRSRRIASVQFCSDTLSSFSTCSIWLVGGGKLVAAIVDSGLGDEFHDPCDPEHAMARASR